MEKSTKIAASKFDSDQLSLGYIRRHILHIKTKRMAWFVSEYKMILSKIWQLNDVYVRKERRFHSLYLEIKQISRGFVSDFHKPLGLGCYCNESWMLIPLGEGRRNAKQGKIIHLDSFPSDFTVAERGVISQWIIESFRLENSPRPLSPTVNQHCQAHH